MKRVPVSVVVITKNETANIEDCLKSVHGWADEIIVVDDGSTDDTVKIAKRFTDKVLSRTMDIEGRHRNWAYAQAKNDWVLSLDADERVTPELQKEIDQILPDNTQFTCFTIPRRNFIADYWLQYGGQYPSAQLRLFSKSKSRFRYEEDEVHPRAKFIHPGRKLDSDIIHYSYKNFEHLFAKLNGQTTLEAKKWFRTGRRVSFGKALWRTLDRFWRYYWRKKGEKDGFYGFIMGYVASFYQIMSYAKYWELKTGNLALSHRDQPAPEIKPYKGKKPPLTIVVITKNEEDNIEDCLRSVHGWADEIMVVDDESTDKTCELAAKYTDKVFKRKMINEGVHRNWAMKQAKNDWIFFLDADEMVTDEIRYEITDELAKGEFDSYSVALKTFIGKMWIKHSGWYPAHKLRIMDRRKQWYKEQEVHPPPMNFVTCKKLKADVFHKGYPGVAHFLSSVNRQTTLEAKKWVKDGRKVSFGRSMYKATDRFFRILIGKQAFRDGFLGFMVAYFASMYQVLSYAKYWELTQKPSIK